MPHTAASVKSPQQHGWQLRNATSLEFSAYLPAISTKSLVLFTTYINLGRGFVSLVTLVILLSLVSFLSFLSYKPLSSLGERMFQFRRMSKQPPTMYQVL